MGHPLVPLPTLLQSWFARTRDITARVTRHSMPPKGRTSTPGRFTAGACITNMLVAMWQIRCKQQRGVSCVLQSSWVPPELQRRCSCLSTSVLKLRVHACMPVTFD